MQAQNSGQKQLIEAESHYTIIFCLGQGATLHLPKLGYSIDMEPGDAIGFLAWKYLHKLEIKNAVGEGGLRPIVFTCWTDAISEAGIRSSGFFDT